MKLYNNKTIIIWYFVANFALFFYLFAFFPVKSKSVNTVIEPPSLINRTRVDVKDLYSSDVEKVVIIVIDALRRDFVQEKYMPYLVSKIRETHGCVLTAMAESPTVTMPRIKAMTTGSVPQFIDIVLNFASSKIYEDSLLHRLKASGKKILFYGDDTWLKLYPNMFFRSEGTSSFYVSDYTEVDNNVTRNLPKELDSPDWDFMILHYLGLDHIGHVYGPFSPLIAAKLKEMDQIINQIYTALTDQTKKSMILICGDHGMRDSGGHGGSSPSETLIPLAILGHSCEKGVDEVVSQTDIAPTVAALSGLPIPADSVGRIIPGLVAKLPLKQQLYMYHYNAVNLVRKNSRIYDGYFEHAINKHEKYLLSEDEVTGKKALTLYKENVLKVSKDLVKTASAQRLEYLYLSSGLLVLSSLVIIQQSDLNIFTMSNSKTLLDYLLVLGTVLTTVCLTATSFIEEEHQTWYFLWGSLAAAGTFTQLKVSLKNSLLWLALFGGVRLLRTLNQVGDKWASEPDTSDWFQKEENQVWLNLVLVIGLLGILLHCHLQYRHIAASLFSLLITLLIFVHKILLQFHINAVAYARLVFVLIAVFAALSQLKYRNVLRTSLTAWVLWSAHVMQPYNVVLVPFCIFASRALFGLISNTESLVIAHIWLSAVLFFAQGNCNSLASIDVSVGYIGLTEYRPLLIGLQVLAHTYTFPVLVQLLLLNSFKNYQRSKLLQVLVAYRASTLAYYVLNTLLQRNHLFVWSVFSPKLLIEAAHSAGLALGVLLYLSADTLTRLKHDSVLYFNVFSYKYN